jgi:hypothetical protein
MNRFAVLVLLLALHAAWPSPTNAQDPATSTTPGQSEKAIQKQQTALYKYQKQQEKSQAKAQRTADKQQRKAAQKYEKQQRKLLKASNNTAKPTS